MAWMTIALVALTIWGLVRAQPVVELEQGKLKGKVVGTIMGDVSEFLGVPYATPPTGELRFQYPKMHKGWKEGSTYDATYYRPACMQRKEFLRSRAGFNASYIDDFQTSEDCLHVNVFVKGGAVPPSGGDAKAVMVWVHGGMFKYGSGELIGSTTKELPEGIVCQGDVILVTFNYRLGLFGLYTTGDTQAPANNGLFDQHLALLWVKRNIAKFGGDPGRITVFGDEAGATSIGLHMLSPYSGGLFLRVALLSSPVFSQTYPDITKAASVSWFAAHVFDCDNKDMDTEEAVKCMQGKDAEVIVENSLTVPSFIFVDHMLLPDQPVKLWDKGGFYPIDMILGSNTGDGDRFMTGHAREKEFLENGVTVDDLMTFPDLMPYLGYPGRAQAAGRSLGHLVKGVYMTEASSPTALLYDCLRATRDMLTSAPAMKGAYINSANGGKSYLYSFSQVSPAAATKYKDAGIPAWATYGSELRYVFGDTTMDTMNEVNPALARSVMNAWTTFAKTGEPEFLVNDKDALKWPAFDVVSMTYAEIKAPMNEASIRTGGVQLNASVFWNILLPSAHNAGMKKLPLYPLRAPTMKGPGTGGDAAKPEGEAEGEAEGEPEGDKWWENMGRPKPEGHWKWVDNQPGGEPEPAGGSEPEQEPEPEMLNPKTMGIAFYVMLGLVAVLVLLMLITMVLACNLKKSKPYSGTISSTKYM